jgi:hypothetical protein
MRPSRLHATDAWPATPAIVPASRGRGDSVSRLVESVLAFLHRAAILCRLRTRDTAFEDSSHRVDFTSHEHPVSCTRRMIHGSDFPLEHEGSVMRLVRARVRIWNLTGAMAVLTLFPPGVRFKASAMRDATREVSSDPPGADVVQPSLPPGASLGRRVEGDRRGEEVPIDGVELRGCERIDSR